MYFQDFLIRLTGFQRVKFQFNKAKYLRLQHNN